MVGFSHGLPVPFMELSIGKFECNNERPENMQRGSEKAANSLVRRALQRAARSAQRSERYLKLLHFDGNIEMGVASALSCATSGWHVAVITPDGDTNVACIAVTAIGGVEAYPAECRQ